MALSNPIKTLKFHKWQGSGNDFILVDDPHFEPQLVQHLCHRRYGVGADGVIWFLAPNRMHIYNPDGQEAPMCGNALRILAHAKKLKTIESSQGMHEVKTIDGQLAVSLGQPQLLSEDPLIIDSGVRHLVLFDGDFDHAPQLRTIHDANVNFVKILAPDTVAIRTYERGVEAETYSCGTGAVAVCFALRMRSNFDGPYHLEYRSGDHLSVVFIDNQSFLMGEAVCTFKGEIDAYWDTQGDQGSRISRGGNTALRENVDQCRP
ncbi:MAG: hypothetical protein KDK50_01380 [Chlamydiia bacterium]|nr:hypothetical protein [Chlamydiia bacterium]